MSRPESKPGMARRWLRRLVFLLVFLFLAQMGVNLWLEKKWRGAGRVHKILQWRLEATFGREVDVGFFQLGLFGRPRIEANFVTIAEDPRFGSEYFLRAEQLSAGLRWRSLLLGRVEFGTIGATRPSLNLVRNEAGEWNLVNWLPLPATVPPITGPEQGGRGRIYRIEVDGGRVNFKQGPDKHPFALVGVSGTVERESTGQWRVDLESQLMRSTVASQETGTIRVSGRMGGTAERLRPASVQVVWEDASLADMLRLTHERDFGVRGEFGLDFTAQTGPKPGEPWLVSGVARLRGVHRWDLPPRAGDPDVDAAFDVTWMPQSTRIELTRAEVDAPGSKIRAAGHLDWGKGGNDALQLQLTSAGVAVSDAFAWYRSFRPAVPANVTVDGNAGLSLRLTGWPPRVEQGAIAIDGARLRAPALANPLALSRVLIRSDRGALVMAPVTLDWEAPAPAIPVAARVRRPPSPPLPVLSGTLTPDTNSFEARLSGSLERTQDARAVLLALGRTEWAGWKVEGPARLNLAWRGSVIPFRAGLAGTIEPRGIALQPAFLSQPVVLTEARIEITPEARSVRVASAQAFGARWNGMFTRNGAQPWEFVVSADRLDVSQMQGWFASDEVPGTAGSPALQARGRVNIGQLGLAPLGIQRLRGTVEVLGGLRELHLADAQGDFYGGAVAGSWRMVRGAEPTHAFDGRFQRVDLELLSNATPALARRFAGVASGNLKLEARGRGREALVNSLRGDGTIEARGALVRGLDISVLGQGTPAFRNVGTASLPSVSGAFSVADGSVRVGGLRLSTPRAEMEATGTVSFAQALDLHLHLLPRTPPGNGPVGEALPPGFRITGTLVAPQVAPLATVPR